MRYAQLNMQKLEQGVALVSKIAGSLGTTYFPGLTVMQVSATFHVRTELLVAPGKKKKLKKKSFKSTKTQLKLQICVESKCKSTR